MQQSEESKYPGQPRDEITQRVIYKHVMAVAPILFALMLVIVIILGVFVFYNGNTNYFDQFLGQAIVSLIGFLILAFIILLMLGTVWIWRRNKVIITDHHIVDIDQIGLFNRTVSTLRLDEIQDISAKINGPLQNMLKYGTIIIQTAGERENFVFDFVPNPYELERYILEARKGHHIKN